MPIAPWLLLSAALAAPVGAVRAQAAPHHFGIGGTLGVSNRGAGGAFRYWFGDRVGLDLKAAWIRGLRYTTTVSTGSSFQALPSIIVMITKPDPTRDVDVRPYVGGGLNYTHTGLGNQPVLPTSSRPQTGGMGMQTFGGVELTFRDAPSVAISAEGVYYRLPVRLVNASVIGGFNYLIAFHYYLR